MGIVDKIFRSICHEIFRQITFMHDYVLPQAFFALHPSFACHLVLG